MNKNLRTAIWRTFGLGTAIGVLGLVACDDVSSTDGSVFERDGSRAAPTESVSRNRPVPDPGRETITEVLRDPNAFARARGLGALLPTLGPDPVEQVEAILMDPVLALHVGATEIELLARYWATFEPEAATNWAVTRSPLVFRTAAVLSTLPVWAKADPFAAVEAARPWMDRKDVSDILVAAVVLGWYSGGDPPELQTFMQELGVSFSRQRALSAYVRTKLRTEGPDALMRWAEAIPEDLPRYKLAVYRQVGFGIAPFDADAALSWCDAHCEGPYGADLRGMVGRGWLLSDPPGALRWLSSSPGSQEARFALRVSYSSWIRADREAAMQWIAEQALDEPPTALIPTYPIYARVLARDSPSRAIRFAELVSDQDGRETILIEIATAWRAKDEAACEAWLEQSPLSEEAREKVRGVEPSVSLSVGSE
jgi:hypothetical protein